MYYLFMDETNQQPAGSAPFFIYGGIFVSDEQLLQVHELVEGIRERHGFQTGDPLKFAARGRPAQVKPAAFKQAKSDLINGCADIGVVFSAYVILHAIASDDLEERVTFGANTIMAAFNRFLFEQQDHGLCFVDRLPFSGDYNYLKTRFQVGLEFKRGKTGYGNPDTRRLERILMFASSCEGASHAMSAIDVILGAFRYCVNERIRTGAAQEMLPQVLRMMWHMTIGGTRFVKDRGLILRPEAVVMPAYGQQYDELVAHLNSVLDAASEDGSLVRRSS